MSKVPFERPQAPYRKDGAVYACADGTYIYCEFKTCRINGRLGKDTNQRKILTAPRNGILLLPGKPPAIFVNEMLTSRAMQRIIRGGPRKTCVLPNTAIAVGKCAFCKNDVASVILNEGLRAVEENCFRQSGIRRLTLTPSVKFIGKNAFGECKNLEYADLSAARGLKSIEDFAFNFCSALKQVLLNDGLETIRMSCFQKSGLERAFIPSSVTYIDVRAFADSPLTQVRFLGISEKELQHRPDSPEYDSNHNTENDCSELKYPQVIGEEAFVNCKSLRQVIFDPGSAVEEIQYKAFQGSGLESFIAPPSLRRIEAVVFRECYNLKKFELNEGVRKLSLFCLFGTGITDLCLPPHIQMTREQLGLDQDPKVLRLPHGLEIVEALWFKDSNIEKLFVPNTVRELGKFAFFSCKKLREIVFEPGSRLETIGEYCFSCCGLEDMVIPKSVWEIGSKAFSCCHNLCSLVFEKGSQLVCVGKDAFSYTQLSKKNVRFLSTAQINGENNGLMDGAWQRTGDNGQQ